MSERTVDIGCGEGEDYGTFLESHANMCIVDPLLERQGQLPQQGQDYINSQHTLCGGQT